MFWTFYSTGFNGQVFSERVIPHITVAVCIGGGKLSSARSQPEGKDGVYAQTFLWYRMVYHPHFRGGLQAPVFQCSQDGGKALSSAQFRCSSVPWVASCIIPVFKAVAFL